MQSKESIFRAACVQLNTGNNLDNNIADAIKSIRKAADLGADFVALPENSVFMSKNSEDAKANALFEDNHPAVSAFSDVAAELKIWILAGTISIQLKNGLLANRAFVFNAKGEIVAKYDKIHMFDAKLAENQQYFESKIFQPGDSAVALDLPWLKLGLTICYDVRFPYLYRSLAHAGAGLIAVPSAFTYLTGKDHWHSLLRARAIENACYIIAPAQCGKHPGNRRTYGHSMVISPWGEIISEAGNIPGIIDVEIDVSKIEEVRNKIPVLNHDKPFIGAT